MKTAQRQFLQNICIGASWRPRVGADDSVSYVDVSLSSYNLQAVRGKHLSPLRWVKGHNLKLKPGKGSGRLTIGKQIFKVVYAWGGRDIAPAPGKPYDYNARTSFIVKIVALSPKQDVVGCMQKLMEDIIFFEKGSIDYKMPYRKYCMYDSKEEGIRRVRHCQTEFKKIAERFGKKVSFDAVKLFEKNWDENKMVTLHHVMDDVQTDMLPKKGKNENRKHRKIA